MILLDSDIMIDLLRRHSPAVAWLSSLTEEALCLPGFVAMELIQGCRDKREQTQLEQVLLRFAIMWPSHEACNQALRTFSHYYLSHGVGLLDALVAHTAMMLGIPLHTFNLKHYAAIPGLKLVQPYVRV